MHVMLCFQAPLSDKNNATVESWTAQAFCALSGYKVHNIEGKIS